MCSHIHLFGTWGLGWTSAAFFCLLLPSIIFVYTVSIRSLLGFQFVCIRSFLDLKNFWYIWLSILCPSIQKYFNKFLKKCIVENHVEQRMELDSFIPNYCYPLTHRYVGHPLSQLGLSHPPQGYLSHTGYPLVI